MLSRRVVPALILAAVLLFGTLMLSGCGYEAKPTLINYDSDGVLQSPDPAHYGGVRLKWTREIHKPVGLLTFPDGGAARETAMYATVYQVGGGKERVIGRITLTPVRRYDYGNPRHSDVRWSAPDRLAFRVSYGYSGSLVREVSGEVVVPPLDQALPTN